MEFMVGDKIEILGIKAIIKEVRREELTRNTSLFVELENLDSVWIVRNDLYSTWPVEAPIKLVERPKNKVKKKFYLGHNGIRHLEDYITCSNLHPDTELLKKAQWDNILEIEIEVDEE